MRRLRNFHLIALSGSCSLMALASPASAQQATDAGDVIEQVNGEAAGQEIVVTATRRSEALSKVPLAVTAVNAQSMQNSVRATFANWASLLPR